VLKTKKPLSDIDNRSKQKAHGFFRNVFKLVNIIIFRIFPIIPIEKINKLDEILK